MAKLILLRHGQSTWNKKNIFTGWVDIGLSSQGIVEAQKAATVLQNLSIDLIYCSTLVRALMTALIAMSDHPSQKVCVVQSKLSKEKRDWNHCYEPKREQEMIPVYCSWHLNERMYGKLQGQNKDEARQQFGKEQVQIWRRSFAQAPPEGESLKMTAARTLPYFNRKILPELKKGKNVLISAHGNSLRSIVMELDQLNESQVVSLEIPTGIPLIYEYSEGRWSKEESDVL